METINPRAGFLCNHEVLTILRQQRDDRARQIKKLALQKAKRVAALKRKPYSVEEEDDEGDRIQPQDLHTVTFEAIKQLEDRPHPMLRQTPASIKALLEELEQLDLTKAERLQIVNLAPTKLVQVVVIVTEFEQRFPSPEQQEHLISLVRAHLLSEPSQPTHLGSSAHATAGLRGANLAPSSSATGSSKSGAAKQMAVTHVVDEDEDDEEESMVEDEATREELDATNELMDEGMGEGGMEDVGKELDEE